MKFICKKYPALKIFTVNGLVEFNNGEYNTTNKAEIKALQGIDDVETAEAAAEQPPKKPEELNKDELKTELDKLNIDYTARANKDELLALLLNGDEENATPDEPEDEPPVDEEGE